MFAPQKEFPLIETYRKQFAITDKTIFAYNGKIYTDYDLPHHLIVHEKVHLEQQDEIGLEQWVYNYLYRPEKRLGYEIEAYKRQLRSIKDRNWRAKTRMESARNLSSSLYGGIISYEEALQKLK